MYLFLSHNSLLSSGRSSTTSKKKPITLVVILSLLSSIFQQRHQSYLLPVATGNISPSTVLKCVVAGAVTTCAVGCIKVVTTGDECLIERFGKYHRKLNAGWHVLLPIIERISFQATTREQVLDVPPQQCYTKDNAPLSADAVVYMRVQDVISAKYNVEDVHSAILNLCLTQLREAVGKLTLDESFSSRERINYGLLKDLNEVCLGWGVEITRVEIQNLQPSLTIKEAMELQMAAERKKRASILKSEGERTTFINEAEGRAQAAITNAEAQNQVTILKAKAEANRQRIEAEGLQVAIEAITEAIMVSPKNSKSHNQNNDDNERNDVVQREKAVEGAIQFLTVLRFLETQAKFASSDNSKIIMLPTKDSLPLTYGGLKFLMDD